MRDRARIAGERMALGKKQIVPPIPRREDDDRDRSKGNPPDR